MTVFVVVCALMVLAAIALMIYPLLRTEPGLASGETPAPKAAPVAFALAVALGLGAVGLYASLNNFPWDNPTTAEALPPGHGSMGAGGSMDDVTATLEARLQQNPNDFEGWRMLGRTYLVTGNAAKAAAAYERANSLTAQKDMALLVDLAEALVLTDDPTVQPRARTIIDEALVADANNQKALWYQGVMAMRSGDNETAKRNFTRLLDSNPPPEIRDVIVSQLQELGAAVPEGAAPTAPMAAAGGMAAGAGMGGGMNGEAAPSGRTVRIEVKVDPALAARLTPGTVVFVSAREPGIPGPPIAATRISTDQLPASVVLSDANAMIEGRDLSSVADLEIVARVAFGGTAVTQSGDLIGSAVQKKGAGEAVAVVIDKVQP
jgi:cytochrome c-type biogenesis protein CcmH